MRMNWQRFFYIGTIYTIFRKIFQTKKKNFKAIESNLNYARAIS